MGPDPITQTVATGLGDLANYGAVGDGVTDDTSAFQDSSDNT